MSSQGNNAHTFDLNILNMLQSVAENQGFNNYTIEETGGSMKGDGYVGVITTVDLKGSSNGEKRVLHLVVKTARKSDALRNNMAIVDVFKREIYMYTVVIPEFQQFLTDKGLPYFSSFVKCYKTSVLIKSEALILDNLAKKGFKLWERRLPMDEDHAALVMKEYGRFHALSFALKDQKPGEYKRLSLEITDLYVKFYEKNDVVEMVTGACNKVADMFTSEEDVDALRLFKNFSDHVIEFVRNLPKLVDHHSIILHGDCWTNNMMFGYDDSDNPKIPTKMCFLDLQIAKLGPPVLDVAYFFYCCTSKDIINNFQYYLDMYYNSLADYLLKMGSNPEELYPYSVFLQQWKQCAKFGLLTSILIMKIMLSEQDEVVDLANVAESGGGIAEAFTYSISKYEEYNDRIKHIVRHFVNNEFI